MGKSFRWLYIALLGLLSLGACNTPIFQESIAPIVEDIWQNQSTPPKKPSQPTQQGVHTTTDVVTLVVTNPRTSVLQNYIYLVSQGILQVPEVRIIGVYHKDDRNDFSSSQQFLAKSKISWITLKEMSCHLSVDTIYSENECTPQFRALFNSTDGIVFSGGPDIPAALYGEKTLLTTVVRAPERHNFELSFLFHLLGRRDHPGYIPLLSTRRDYVVLGMCLGMQSMNVALGGTLFQDIPAEVYGVKTFEEVLTLSRQQRHKDYNYAVNPAQASQPWLAHIIHVDNYWDFVGREFAKPPLVLSYHHQALEKLGSELFITATSEDGRVVEAIGHHQFPNVGGVQFHPESRKVYTSPQFDAFSRSFHEKFWQRVAIKLQQSYQLRTYQQQVAPH